MRRALHLGFALFALGCADPAMPPQPRSAAPTLGSARPPGAPPVVAEPPQAAGGDDWARCSQSSECALVLTRAGACCDFGEHKAVNARYEAEARRAWGPSEAQLRQAEERGMICKDDCAAPPRLVAECRAGTCVVASATDAGGR